MRRFIPLLLLACLLFLPQATPEVAANTEPTIPAPRYEVPLPLILQLSPDPRIVCTLVAQTSSGGWLGTIRNTSDQHLHVYSFYSHISFPYLGPGMEVAFNDLVGCRSFYTEPSPKQVLQLETSPVHRSFGGWSVRNAIFVTNTTTFTVTDIRAGAVSQHNDYYDFPFISQSTYTLGPGESMYFVRSESADGRVRNDPYTMPQAFGFLSE